MTPPGVQEYDAGDKVDDGPHKRCRRESACFAAGFSGGAPSERLKAALLLHRGPAHARKMRLARVRASERARGGLRAGTRWLAGWLGGVEKAGSLELWPRALGGRERRCGEEGGGRTSAPMYEERALRSAPWGLQATHRCLQSGGGSGNNRGVLCVRKRLGLEAAWLGVSDSP